MDAQIAAKVQEFIEAEQQFHLGFLPTEQSNPLSRHVDEDFRRSGAAGVRTLQKVDGEVLPMARKILGGAGFAELVERGVTTLEKGGRIVFSGCGATGRLSILLEAMWRRGLRRLGENPRFTAAARRYEDSVFSIMTGGDYALIKSVEFFEDYAVFGRRQVMELNLTADDLLVAITEGGETSSVLGSVAEATERGAHTFLLFNNPAELLAAHLERSRAAIQNPRVTVLDLYCGPMGIAGSTRMQATTSEQLVAGAALELILARLIPGAGAADADFAEAYAELLAQLGADAAVQATAGYLEFEEALYRAGGKVTYFAADFLLDLFTDTTERSPTFMLPAFNMSDDPNSPLSWAFVKNPLLSTPEAWAEVFGRHSRCLNWQAEDYRRMAAPAALMANPPRLNHTALMKFEIGRENVERRMAPEGNAAVLFAVETHGRAAELRAEFARLAPRFQTARELLIGPATAENGFAVPFAPTRETPLRLMTHLAVKLTMNNISTGTMVRFGRVAGNWMSWVSVSNKKLMDRGVRLLMELAGVDYRTGCTAIFEAIAELDARDWTNQEKPSPVQYALAKLKR